MNTHCVPCGGRRTRALLPRTFGQLNVGHFASALSFIFFSCFLPTAHSQSTLSKEYIHLGGRVIAIENPAVTVNVTAPQSTIAYGTTIQFSATISGLTNQSVTWSVPAGEGAINSSGSYTAPAAQSSSMQVTITATSVAVPAVSGNYTLTVNPIFLPPGPIEIGSGGVTGNQVNVTQQGSWTATSDSSFIHITSPANGAGAGIQTLTYNVDSNSSSQRTGHITILGTQFTITQDAGSGGATTVTVSPTVINYPPNSSSSYTTVVTVSITGPPLGTPWGVTIPQGTSWITYNSCSCGTSGVGTVNIVVQANSTLTTSITVAGQTISVSPTTNNASITVDPNSASAPGGGGNQIITINVTVNGTITQAWSAVSNVSWIQVSTCDCGTVTGVVKLNVTPNGDVVNSQIGTVTVANQTVTVTQAPGVLSITPIFWSLAVGGSKQFQAWINATPTNQVAWSLSGAPSGTTISSTGNLMAGSLTSPSYFTVIATALNTTVSANAYAQITNATQAWITAPAAPCPATGLNCGFTITIKLASSESTYPFYDVFNPGTELLISTGPSSRANSCDIKWLNTGGATYMSLANDAANGNTAQGLQPLGSNISLSNSQCTIDVKDSTQQPPGNTFFGDGSAQFLFGVTFTNKFIGSKNVYLTLTSINPATGGTFTNIAQEQIGTWNVTGPAPTVSANAGSPQSTGISTAFASALQAKVTDVNGNGVSGVPVTFTAPQSGPGAAFSSGNTATATTNSSGVATAPTLTANAQPGIYTVAATISGSSSQATFTLTNTGTAVSINPVSVTPNTGAGTSMTFAEVYSDSAGGADITQVSTFFRSSYAANPTDHACYVLWTKTGNTLSLDSDSGNPPNQFGTGLPLGQAGTLSNSQCTVNVGSSSLSATGNNLTLTLVITFKAAFAGTQQIWMSANNATVSSPWVSEGTWIVPNPPSFSVSPSANSGPALTLQDFYFTFTDPSGAASILSATFDFGTTASGCYVSYSPSANTLALANDAGTFQSPLPIGVPGTEQNSQCIMDAGTSSVTISGNSIGMDVNLTFKTAFAGTKNVYMELQDAQQDTGLVQAGTWTITTGSGSQISVGSVTPNTGVGSSVTLSEVYSDTAGGSDIIDVWTFLRNIYAAYPTNNACYVHWNRVTNSVNMTLDAGGFGSPIVIGQTGTLSNSQCSLNVGASSLSISGNNLTLNLALTFTASFAGTQQIWMEANNGNIVSGWVQGGTWNTTPAPGTTIATSPAGLAITVDGSNYTAPQTFQWISGSSHTIAVSSPLAGPTGTQYLFNNWSDGLAQTHSITVPTTPTTYRANFDTQYQLTTAASPSSEGTISPSSGWYAAGASVPVSATANTGDQFTGFSGSLTGTSSPQNLTMNAPSSVTANFGATVTTTIATSPAGLAITVDGANYTAPQSFQWASGFVHDIAVASPIAIGTGAQYAFATWSDAGAQMHSITVPATATTYTATFTTQYLLTTTANPSADGTVNPVTAWYNAGSVVSVSASAVAGCNFTGFSGDLTGTTNPQNVTMSVARSVSANFSGTPTGNGYTYSRAVTIAHGQVPNTDQTNFPMVFNTTDPLIKTTANGGHVTNANGYDIIFTSDAAGTLKLNHEIESFNGSTGQFVAWVQIPTLSHTTDTVVYLFYGNSGITTSQENKTGVWDSNYKLVMHLSNQSGTILDSTSNANNGTANSGATYTSSGLAGGAYAFNGTGGLITVPNNASWAGNYSGFTMEAWVKAAGFPDYTGFLTVGDWNGKLSLWSYNNTYTSFAITTSYGYCQSPASTVPYSNSSYTFLAATFDGTVMTPFVNGAQANQFPPSCPGTMQLGTAPLELGGFQTQKFLPGALDEVRISAAPRSANWLATEYNNLISPGTFYSLGSESGSSGPTTTIATSPAGLAITVDGSACTAPCFYQWTAGSNHTINTASPQAGAAGTQYLFANWSDSGAQSHSVTAPSSATTYTASFTTQYQLTTNASPTADGSISPASGWISAGTVVPVSATANTGYQFTGFSGALSGTTSPQNLTMSAPLSVTANFSSPTVTATVTATPGGLSVIVDGTTYLAPQTFQWVVGTAHTVAVSSPQVLSAGAQFIFANWSDAGAQSHSITVPSSAPTYTANFTEQYQLTTAANPSAGGSISPASGWNNAGNVVSVRATPNAGYQFTGFSGALSGTTNPQNLTISGQQSVTANFATSGNGYAHSRTVTIAHSQVSSTQTNFPFLFNTTDSLLKTVANGGHVNNANGWDIILTSDAAGTQKLNHEIESYNGSTGQFIAWVQIPTLSSSTDTVIYIFYGNSTITTSQENKTGVWSNNYQGVWHLANGTTLSAIDSTSNANNGTFTGTPTAVAGQIDGAGGSWSNANYINNGNNASLYSSVVTVSAWLNASSLTSVETAVSEYDNDNAANRDWALGLDTGGTHWRFAMLSGTTQTNAASSVSVVANSWHYVVGEYNGSALSLYVDGALAASTTVNTTINTVHTNFLIGRRTSPSNSGIPWSGSIDEVRYSNIALSASWITTEYNNQHSPGTFYSLGAEQ